jgi:major intracellular serine protease
MKLLKNLSKNMKNQNFLKVLIILQLICIPVFCKTISVLEIDTGVDISHPEIRSHINIGNWKNPNYEDFHGHGTHIAGIILKDVCDEVELTSCKYYDLSNKANSPLDCFREALKHHYDIVNFSSGGPGFDQKEYDILKNIKSTIVVAAGNDSHDLSVWSYYPASYNLKNIIPVGNLEGKVINQSSNYGLKNMVWEQGTRIYSFFPGGRYGIMTGTSQAAALHTNKLLKELCEKN